MQYYLKYLRHYLVSHSRHGTHSPFVYQLVDEVLYRKPHAQDLATIPLTYKRGGKKEMKKYLCVERLLKVFAFENFKIWTESEQQEIAFLFERNRTHVSHRIIHFINRDENYLAVLDDVNEDDLLIIDEPHKSRDREVYWKLLKQTEKVVVTIDLFHLGLVFFRKGQRKEDFVIRF